MQGGAADRSGLVCVGDEVMEVNGVAMKDKSPQDIRHVLSEMSNSVTMKLIPAPDAPLYSTGYDVNKVYMKCLFSYDPIDDPEIPCKEAGLIVNRGDVIQIVDQSDARWWQARHVGEVGPAGLILSPDALRRRNDPGVFSASVDGLAGDKKAAGLRSVAFSPKHHKKLGKSKRKGSLPSFSEAVELCQPVVTYEEVVEFRPPANVPRPIVLIGSPGIGRNELMRQLITSDPVLYRTVVPFTSRPPRPGEENGRDYIFVSRRDMEDDIASGRYLEFGEWNGHLYGTSVDSIMHVISTGRVCVIAPHPQSIPVLRCKEIKPAVVFVRPPSLDELRETRVASGAVRSEGSRQRPFTEDDFQQMILSSRRLELHVASHVDVFLTNLSLDHCVAELIDFAASIREEATWVAAAWTK